VHKWGGGVAGVLWVSGWACACVWWVCGGMETAHHMCTAGHWQGGFGQVGGGQGGQGGGWRSVGG
jgi:hypothetical protein